MKELLPADTIISHYRILARLGAGSIGEVYLAEDTRLGRQVALKFLPASYQYDPDRRARFLKEARAASALRSPNIAAIYDIDEHEGAIFIVMEYVEGESLTARIERGPIGVREAVEIALQVADALAEAHSLGIVHANIKSSNLIINERGMVKILDFGIAKVAEPISEASDSDNTQRIGGETTFGHVPETLAYMSPEQAFGRALDHRTDIFSLGVVFYEMLAGRLPFLGESFTEVVDRIAHDEPLPPSRYNYSVPAELERITRKCLEKSPDLRYQSMRELVIDLQSFKRDSDSGQIAMASGRQTQLTRRPRSRKAIDSLAILPFINASRDADADYLSDGITESIISNLSQLPRLRVMARSTVFRYKDREVDPQEIGRDLNVRAVLTGRVLQRSDRLVIKTELVDTSDGAQLWGEQYNRPLADIFSMEEEIAREISEKLRLKLSGEQKKRLTKRHTENTRAYHLYLKGRYYWNKRTEDGIKKGIEHFHEAITADPNYGLAYAGLADCYVLLAGYSSHLPEEVFPVAKAAALKALKLDEALAEAHTSLAAVRAWYDWDWAGAELRYKRAIEINPGYATAYVWYALNLATVGRLDEALLTVKRAEELDPLSLIISLNVARILYFARRYDEAVEQCLKVFEIDSSFVVAHRRMGQIYHQKAMYDEAIAEYKKALALAKNDSETMSALGYTYAISGQREEAIKVLERVENLSKQEFVSPYSVARLYLGLGDIDRTMEWLERTYEERHSILIYTSVDPVFDSLRANERFQNLMQRMGL
jgi:serine/threonine-protein kinase